ncbi:hypothetical protein HRR83_006186 [Exophiala dermatitidis]|uniref:BTB domain-containing protein n=1 Tax=Exophiala dermatitidis TaxID=5970 RepID=A0AAN6EP93_EXODE|nr:hypothetical protein HRR75_005114 [Exophiala dermatitidis]KAJ4515117.1 hypothetical protein HRR74_005582 [Exophiala dermatitidis]KAJ4517610.1 hypothetical protein HRR73_004662 [Exophiala dermatitidis]KAJ4548631.1 hypothetical protein HRR76_001221 [Exophiala dermatitidis]KAJ4550447.1 hypothetical protein HRR78_004216 [Exophiala dermatitidis]
MGTLGNLLSTAEGCNFVLICEGEFFFVHKSVLAAQSTVLKEATCNSDFLLGEAYVTVDIPPPVFRKVLCFLYRGDISDFPGLAHLTGSQRVSPPVQYFHRTFPVTNTFLKTVIGKPAPNPSKDSSLPPRDLISIDQKWSILVGKQCTVKDLYDENVCSNPAAISQEMDVYAAADKLHISTLKELSMKKALGWFAKELQAGLPLSDDLRKIADFVLRSQRAFVKPFFCIYAKFLPTLGMNPFFAKLMEELDPDSFEMCSKIHSQFMAERNQFDKALEQSKQQIALLEGDVTLLKAENESAAKTLGAKTESLRAALSAAQAGQIAAEAKADLLGNLNKGLQTDLLISKVEVQRAKEKIKPEPKLDVQVIKDNTAKDKEIEKLKQEIATAREKLKFQRTAHDKFKKGLKIDKNEKEQLSQELSDLQTNLDALINDINNSGHCHGCRRQWNMKLDQDRYPAIRLRCKLCRKDSWYYSNGQGSR